MKQFKQPGFTLVELLLAMTLFSFVLVFSSAGIVQIYRAYNKGATVKRVQEDARTIIEDVVRELRVRDKSTPIEICVGPSPDPTTCSDVSTNTDRNRLCIGNNIRYVWNVAGHNNWGDNTPEQWLKANGTPRVPPEYINFSKKPNDNFADDGCKGDMKVSNESTTFIDEDIVVQYFNVTPMDPTQTIFRIQLILSIDHADLIEGVGLNAKCKGSTTQGTQYCSVVNLATTVSIRN
jgi:prepilin-type N-terminal cleavage/methylation domain-containing protein